MSAAPQRRDPLGWSAPDNAPFIDTVTGIEYPSRNALKKAVRVRLDKTKEPRELGSRRRLQRAIGSIIAAEGLVVKDEVTAAITRCLDRIDVGKMFEAAIEAKVAEHFGTRFTSQATRETQMQTFISETIVKQVEKALTKMIKNDLQFDIKVRGEATSIARPGRKVDLDHDLEDGE